MNPDQLSNISIALAMRPTQFPVYGASSSISPSAESLYRRTRGTNPRRNC